MWHDLVFDAVDRLREAGCDSPQADVRIITEHVAGIPIWRLNQRVTPTAQQTELFSSLVSRREAREPLQHILGVAHFRFEQLHVGPGVFIPRPETEMVAEFVIDQARQMTAPRVIELCAGSGAIALSVAREVPESSVTAIEVSDEAIEYLRRNVEPLVTVIHDDIRTPQPHLAQQADIVVVNPPYVPIADADLLSAEVQHDPELALFAGDDGLEFIPIAADAAATFLEPGGLLVMEHGDDQAESVRTILESRWYDVCSHRDLTQRDRFVSARLSPERTSDDSASH